MHSQQPTCRPASCLFPAIHRSEADCRDAVAATVRQHGALDVLVNNAAIQPPASYVRVDELPAELWQQMVDVNLSGYTFLAKHALKQMREQGSGVVVNLASGQAHRTARKVPLMDRSRRPIYCRRCSGGSSTPATAIRVVSVSPGAIDTPLVRASLTAQGGEAELANRHPLGRLGDVRTKSPARCCGWRATPLPSSRRPICKSMEDSEPLVRSPIRFPKWGRLPACPENGNEPRQKLTATRLEFRLASPTINLAVAVLARTQIPVSRSLIWGREISLDELSRLRERRSLWAEPLRHFHARRLTMGNQRCQEPFPCIVCPIKRFLTPFPPHLFLSPEGSTSFGGCKRAD